MNDESNCHVEVTMSHRLTEYRESHRPPVKQSGNRVELEARSNLGTVEELAHRI